MLKKVFGGLKMTWPVVLIFAVLAGVITALIAMFVPDENSLHEVAVSFEAWILFAILIIVNCDKPLEAACKTFVFFLISQPLVYLIQVPFNALGWQLFGYYKYWFMITLLTFPGAFLGWFIKKDNVWSGLILSVMLGLLVMLGMGYLRTTIRSFPSHLISTLFCFGQIPLYIFGILKNRKARLAAAIITVLAVLGMGWYALRQPARDMMTVVDLDESKYAADENWTVTVADEKISTAELFSIDGDYYLRIHIYGTEPNVITLHDGRGNEYKLTVSYEEDYGTRVIEGEGS